MREPITAYIGLGGNMGNRADVLRRAVRALDETDGIRVTKRSSVYETEPIGPPQRKYLNAVVQVETTLAPRELLKVCLDIEARLGRTRDPEGERHGPRPIDLDILLYAKDIVADPDLVVPHPHLHGRAFALTPLVEIAPTLEHPAMGRTLRDILAEVGQDGVQRTEETL